MIPVQCPCGGMLDYNCMTSVVHEEGSVKHTTTYVAGKCLTCKRYVRATIVEEQIKFICVTN